MRTAAAICALILTLPAAALEPPAGLPRYDLVIDLDTTGRLVRVAQRVTWTNRSAKPADELVFNVYPHYKIPDKDFGLLAKTVEILRQNPSENLDAEGRIGHVERVRLAGVTSHELPVVYRTDIDTAMTVALPLPVPPGASVSVDIDYTIRLPEKQGRWGQWDGITYLATWLPVLAVHDDAGWQPVPFVPWHQPFFNEAGIYTATITLPCDQKLACSGPVVQEIDLGDGRKRVTTAPVPLRDFAIACSSLYQEMSEQVGPVTVKVLALPRHASNAQVALRAAADSIAQYSEWFGQYPYPQYTIAETYFPWNGNECGAMVFIDYRVFNLPDAASGYVDYLLTHEVGHQWWYNMVGTNGYAETFMDEAPTSFFSHKFLDRKHGKNNNFLKLPAGLQWLPKLKRDNYRYASMSGTIARGEMGPAVQPIDQFEHVVNLFSSAYDRGSKIMGMIEARMGEPAFMDFMRCLFRKYYFRVLRVADFQRELEAYTGYSWDEFFQQWVHGRGLSDWSVDTVDVKKAGGGCVATVLLKQRREIDEPTVLGVKFPGGDGYAVRIPVVASGEPITLDDPPARIESVGDHLVCVQVRLPCEPEQVTVDPDKVLQDANPANNHWKPECTWRLTPLYTQLDETDIAADYDRWNVIAGPWFYMAPVRDPWYARSNMIGARAGVYRTQQFNGGAFLAYRGDYRDLVAGVDGLLDHWPGTHTQIGFNVEQRLGEPIGTDAPSSALRAVLFGRYIFAYHSSLYLMPMHFIGPFVQYQDNALPYARDVPAGANRPERQTTGGVHYHIDYLTPYWDPEGGFKLDLVYQAGSVDLEQGTRSSTQQVSGQLVYARTPPAWTGKLANTKLAFRGAFGAATPDQALLFAFGGGSLFRGFDLAERQGSAFWLGTVEWRVPLSTRLNYDAVDRVFGLRGVHMAAFYDVGSVYVNGRSVGDTAHAVGLGVRADMTFFSIVERGMFRFDVAKTINDNTPVQFWLGFSHAF